MKIKITITSILLSSFALANDYLVIVDKNHNKYDVVESGIWIDTSSSYTEWEYTGLVNNCNSWSPSINNQKLDFSQTRNCDLEQSRIRSDIQTNDQTSETRVNNTEIEKQKIIESETRNVEVTKDLLTIEKENYNCDNWYPLSSSIYTGTIFEQERFCDVDLSQNWNYIVESNIIENWEEKYTESSGYETQFIEGTKEWDEVESTYTEWKYTGINKNCTSWSPSINNQKLDFSQNKTCENEQSRTRTDSERNNETSETRAKNTEVEKRYLTETENRIISVIENSIIKEKENYNCKSWTPLQNETYKGTTLQQSRTCSVDYMKEWSYSLDSLIIGNWEERYTDDTAVENQNVFGTLVLSTCNEILTNGHSRGDGSYIISLNGETEVQCDMTRNGGGWTQISNYNFAEDPNNIPQGLNKTVNRTITISSSSGTTHTFRDAWYPNDEVPLDENNFNWTEIVVPTNGMSWTQTMIDLHSYFERTIDGFNVTTSTRDSYSVNGQYLDGVSLTYGNDGARSHLFSSSRIDKSVQRLDWLSITDNDLFNDYGVLEDMTGDNAFVSGIKENGTENISARLMVDQNFRDEFVGLYQFTVWIK